LIPKPAFGKWSIEQAGPDEPWSGSLEIPSDKVGEIGGFRSGQKFMAEFYKDTDIVYEGQITLGKVKRSSSSTMAEIRFKGNGVLNRRPLP
jgi:hypothetical protein